MKTVRVPLVGSLTSRDATNTALYGVSQRDQYFEDCDFHITRNQLTGKTTVKVGPRELFTTYIEPSAASGNGTAVIVWRGKSGLHYLSAFGSTNSTIYVDTTSLGAITGVCEHISETVISGVATGVFVSEANLGYYYIDGGTLTEITDIDFPPKQTPALTLTGNFVHMDGYAFIMCTNGQIWHSDVNTLVNWTSTANITAQEYPDPGVALARVKNLIVAFSGYSMEVFINGSNQAGAILSRVQNMTQRIGLINEHAIAYIGSDLAFIGRDLVTNAVYLMNGVSLERISTGEIEHLLREGSNDGRLHALTSSGKHYIGLTMSANSSNVYVYDLDTKIWQLWTLEAQLRQSDCGGGGCIYVGYTSSVIYANAGNSWASGTIQIGPIDFGSRRRKTLRTLRVVGNKATSASAIAVSWSDDDGQTGSTARNVDMLANDPKLERCGTFRRRMFKLTGLSLSSADRPMLLEALDLDLVEHAT